MAINSNLNGSLTQVYDGMVQIEKKSPSGAGTVSFTSIPSSGFKDLVFVVYGAGTQVSTSTSIQMTFNGDTGANYDLQYMQNTSGTTAGASEVRAGTSITDIIALPAASAPANTGGSGYIYIPDYGQTTFHHSGNAWSNTKIGTSANQLFTRTSAWWWRSTAAITRVDLTLASGNFVTGTTITLYALSNTVGATLATGDTNMAVYGRLTTETLVPVSTSDRTSQSTLYFTPYNGASIPLYNGTRWVRRSFSEISLALSGLTSAKNYDVFVYDNAGVVTLELSAAWASDTARTDSLALQNGVYVKSGTPTRLWLGTVRTTSTTTVEDSKTKRFVWNNFNRINRSLSRHEATTSWTYTTATFRQANASASNQVEAVVGLTDSWIEVDVHGQSNNSNTAGALTVTSVGVGVNSTSTNSAQIYVSSSGTTNSASILHYMHPMAIYKAHPTLGYSFYAWLEYSRATSTTTWTGDDASATEIYHPGMIGRIKG